MRSLMPIRGAQRRAGQYPQGLPAAVKGHQGRGIEEAIPKLRCAAIFPGQWEGCRELITTADPFPD